MGWRSNILGWRPNVLGWGVNVLGWGPAVWGWRPNVWGWRPNVSETVVFVDVYCNLHVYFAVSLLPVFRAVLTSQ